MGGKPIPEHSFLNECDSIGAPDSNKRWRSKDRKKLYTWDSLHGEIEVFNARGEHLGVLDPEGTLIKPAKKGRTINV